jgi:hypothetical protein
MPSRLERVQSPSRRRLLARVDGAAFLAGARLLVVEERLIERRQVLDQVRDLDLDAMYQRVRINRYSNVILKNKSCRRKSMSDRRPA